jgi:hypothetical protein
VLSRSAESHSPLHNTAVILTGRDLAQNVWLSRLDPVGNRY